MKTILAAALLCAAFASHATDIASQYTCTDGSVLRLSTTTERAQVEHLGVAYPVRSIEHGAGFVNIMAGIKNTKTIMLAPPDLNAANTLPRFFVTYAQTPTDDSHTIECTADRSSRRLNW